MIKDYTFLRGEIIDRLELMGMICQHIGLFT